MARDRFSVLALGLASLLALAAACGGDPADFDPTPELFNLEISPNPVDANTETIFIISWRDDDGDMAHPTVSATLTTDYDETFELPIEELGVEGGPHAGALTFHVLALDSYQGNVAVTVTDEAGHESNEIEQYLYVNATPAETD